jgi:uncharacterized protein DUF4267
MAFLGIRDVATAVALFDFCRTGKQRELGVVFTAFTLVCVTDTLIATKGPRGWASRIWILWAGAAVNVVVGLGSAAVVMGKVSGRTTEDQGTASLYTAVRRCSGQSEFHHCWWAIQRNNSPTAVNFTYLLDVCERPTTGCNSSISRCLMQPGSSPHPLPSISTPSSPSWNLTLSVGHCRNNGLKKRRR